jgi:hypothetical protein
MIPLLLVITCASLCLSAGLLVYVLRLTRRERDRSEARAAALAETLARYGLDSYTEAANAARALERTGVNEPNLADALQADEPLDTVVPVADHVAGIARPAEPEQEAIPEDTGRLGLLSQLPRTVVIPALGVAVVALLLGGLFVASRSTSRGTQAAATARTTEPLELVSLKHERQGDGIVITGVVRNPPDGQPISRLAAVAFLFDRQGNYLSSSRSLLDYTQLRPGEESPFSIAVPSAASVGRYRISFRTDDGIVPHRDRRSDPPAMPAASR